MLKCNSSRQGDVVKVTFALASSDVSAPVSVVGEFNGWDPYAHPLKKRSNGTLSAIVDVASGQTWRFKYLGVNGNWFCDPDADTVTNDEYDTLDSLLVV